MTAEGGIASMPQRRGLRIMDIPGLREYAQNAGQGLYDREILQRHWANLR
jgi:hypothetical protein